MHPKDAKGIANSVDPDQTAPLGLGAVWSGSALFAQTCLSENITVIIFIVCYRLISCYYTMRKCISYIEFQMSKVL